MRWESPAAQRPDEWHEWFAWHPVRIPASRYEAGHWVWREVVWRKDEGWVYRSWRYKFEDPRPAEEAREREWQKSLRELSLMEHAARMEAAKFRAPGEPEPIRPVGRAPKKGKKR